MQIINNWCKAVYAVYAQYGQPDQFRSVVYTDTPHSYTQKIWEETLAWLKAKL